MALDSLPAEILRHIAIQLEHDRSSLCQLSLTCQLLAKTCQPLLYRHLQLDDSHQALFPLAYTLLTNPSTAHEVRSIRLPALAIARKLEADESSERRGWPEGAQLDVLDRELGEALGGDADAELVAAVRDGTREDLVAMLVLRHVSNLEELHIGAMGPRDNAVTRAMFRHAAPHLHKLTTVHFGETPKDLSDSDEEERTDLEYSHSLFADLWLLPAVREIHAYAIGPRNSEDIEASRWESLFDFVLDIKSDNTSLTRLVVAEQLAATNAHLDHLFKHSPKLQSFSFMSRPDSGTDDMMYDWGTRWDRKALQATLETRADSLRSLNLPDCLFHDEATLDDERSKITLRSLRLTSLDIDDCWIFDAGDLGYEDGTYDPAYAEKRLVSLLPATIESLTITSNGDGGPLDEATNLALKGLVRQHGSKEGFRKLESISIHPLDEDVLDIYRETFDEGKKEGLRMYIREESSDEG